jgi:hypothetical protein
VCRVDDDVLPLKTHGVHSMDLSSPSGAEPTHEGGRAIEMEAEPPRRPHSPDAS